MGWPFKSPSMVHLPDKIRVSRNRPRNAEPNRQMAMTVIARWIQSYYLGRIQQRVYVLRLYRHLVAHGLWRETRTIPLHIKNLFPIVKALISYATISLHSVRPRVVSCTTRAVLYKPIWINVSLFHNLRPILTHPGIDLLISSQCPIDRQFLAQAIEPHTTWFPLAFSEDIWLQKITMFSGLHLLPGPNASDVLQINSIAASVLSHLNHCIQIRDVSDIVIVGAAFLSLAEHLKGNEEVAAVHANGLTELIRVRGGLTSLDRLHRLMVVRADIIRSVDILQPPLLHRPTDATVPTTKESLMLDQEFAGLLRGVASNVASSEIMASLWTLKSISQDIEAVRNGHSSFDAVSYYESLLCLNHDLLSLTPSCRYEEILRLSVLNFTQPMFRFGAFHAGSCQARSIRLRIAMEFTDLRFCSRTILLWITFVGFMLSHGTSEHTSFKQSLQKLLDQSNIPRKGSWSILQIELKRFIWIDCIHDICGSYFYDTIEDDAVI